MARRQKKLNSIWILIALILGGIAMLFAAQIGKTEAYAGSSWNELTFDETTFKYSKEGEEVKRNVYVDEELYVYLEKITYSVVSSETDTVFTQQVRFNDLGVVQNKDVVVEKKDVLVTNIEKTNFSGKKAYGFTVSCDHCCAFIFTVYYANGEGEEDVVKSQILYVSSIDGVAPTVKLESYNPYMNTITCSLSDSQSVCAASGIKSYTVYQEDGETKQRTELVSSNSPSKKVTFKLPSGTGKYNYYVIATDNVGNVSKEVLVATYDVDELYRSADNAAKTIASAPDEWSDSFKSRFERAFSEYEAIIVDENESFTQEEKEKKAAALSAVLEEYRSYVGDKINDDKRIDVSVSGQDYLEGGVTLTNVKEACSFIKYGEDGALTVAIAKHDYSKDKEIILRQTGLSEADEAYLFTFHLSTTEQVNRKEQFSVPFRPMFSVGEYRSVAAVQVSEEDGNIVYTPCPVTEYTNGNVVLNVQNTYGTVYLFVQKENKENTWWYLFFLFIPLTAGTVSAIILLKKYKRSKK